MDEIVREFDAIIEEAPVDFLGTGSDHRCAYKEEQAWRARIEHFRQRLLSLKISTEE